MTRVHSALYSVVVALHVVSALGGFGAVALTGWFAAALRRPAGGSDVERLRRYFRPGRNWVARALLLVPVFGATLLALGHGADVGQPYPWIGLSIWLVTIALVSAVVWPGERAIQRVLASAGAPVLDEALRATCRRLERVAGVTSVLFVVAVAVMVIQPG